MQAEEYDLSLRLLRGGVNDIARLATSVNAFEIARRPPRGPASRVTRFDVREQPVLITPTFSAKWVMTICDGLAALR